MEGIGIIYPKNSWHNIPFTHILLQDQVQPTYLLAYVIIVICDRYPKSA